MKILPGSQSIFSTINSAIVKSRFISISLLVCNALLCTLIGVVVLRPASKDCERALSEPISNTASQTPSPVATVSDDPATPESAKPEPSENSVSDSKLIETQANKTQTIGIDLEKYRELTKGL